MPAVRFTPTLLFVYGTLRPALARDEPARLIVGLRACGKATVRGLLYDLGGYPGLVPGEGTVQGDLLEITSPEQLAALDAYEECDGPHPLYRRELMPAVRAEGDEVLAWVYLYAGSLAAARLIPAGDYSALRSRGPVAE